MSVLWHYIQNGASLGPIPEEQLRALISSGGLRPSDQVWHEGMAGWSPIQSLPELAALVPPPAAKAAPVQAPQGQAQAPPPKSGKVWPWILGGCGVLLLLVLLGGIGIAMWMRSKVGDLQRNPAVAAAELLVRANPELEVVSTDYAKGTLTVRNRKSGETLTMDAADIKQGRLSFRDEKGSEIRFKGPEGGSGVVQIQGPEGQTSIGAGTKVQAPSWLPTYPATPVEGLMSLAGKDGITGTIVQKTQDSTAQVMESFEKALKAGGFEVNTIRNPEGGIVIGEWKGMKRHVMATIGRSQGQTVATVTYRERN
ncbi:MAG: DUF4339 domain-containing protein [Holophagaceae bacterium]|uniref:DUF4339 domain-containing protein n=1 Tax=Candidatus Geothrix skivensis TaxID=2954439 RepID=A0A9D7SEE7_9BACT|nr:DUF4339 domain-containing protein [Candidatus Geothrix skivensis]